MRLPATAVDLSVIVFAFDEEQNVPLVLDELVRHLRSRPLTFEVVFVDDGSRDGTRGAAERALSTVPSVIVGHATNLGIGAALKTGFSAARGEYVTFLPADGQVAPDAIDTLWNARDGNEIVFSVYDHRDDGAYRTLLSFGVRALIRAVHGVTMTSDGPYLVRRALFDATQLRPDSFFLNFELPIRVSRAALPCAVVTIACRPRISGQSKSAGLRRIVGVARELAALRVRRASEAVSRLAGGPLDP